VNADKEKLGLEAGVGLLMGLRTWRKRGSTLMDGENAVVLVLERQLIVIGQSMADNPALEFHFDLNTLSEVEPSLN
jgi:hypothetical protein